MCTVLVCTGLSIPDIDSRFARSPIFFTRAATRNRVTSGLYTGSNLKLFDGTAVEDACRVRPTAPSRDQLERHADAVLHERVGGIDS
jgi:hypothetical protein